MTTVLCMGVFDILHDGHRDYFRQAKEHGDYLIVIVAHDKNVEKDKGKPKHTQEERVKAVAAEKLVDEARNGYPGDKLKIVEEIKPDVIVLGYDIKVTEEQLAEVLRKRGLTPKIIRAKAYQPEKYKSSLLT